MTEYNSFNFDQPPWSFTQQSPPFPPFQADSLQLVDPQPNTSTGEGQTNGSSNPWNLDPASWFPPPTSTTNPSPPPDSTTSPDRHSNQQASPQHTSPQSQHTSSATFLSPLPIPNLSLGPVPHSPGTTQGQSSGGGDRNALESILGRSQPRTGDENGVGGRQQQDQSRLSFDLGQGSVNGDGGRRDSTATGSPQSTTNQTTAAPSQPPTYHLPSPSNLSIDPSLQSASHQQPSLHPLLHSQQASFLNGFNPNGTSSPHPPPLSQEDYLRLLKQTHSTLFGTAGGAGASSNGGFSPLGLPIPRPGSAASNSSLGPPITLPPPPQQQQHSPFSFGQQAQQSTYNPSSPQASAEGARSRSTERPPSAQQQALAHHLRHASQTRSDTNGASPSQGYHPMFPHPSQLAGGGGGGSPSSSSSLPRPSTAEGPTTATTPSNASQHSLSTRIAEYNPEEPYIPSLSAPTGTSTNNPILHQLPSPYQPNASTSTATTNGLPTVPSNANGHQHPLGHIPSSLGFSGPSLPSMLQQQQQQQQQSGSSTRSPGRVRQTPRYIQPKVEPGGEDGTGIDGSTSQSSDDEDDDGDDDGGEYNDDAYRAGMRKGKGKARDLGSGEDLLNGFVGIGGTGVDHGLIGTDGVMGGSNSKKRAHSPGGGEYSSSGSTPTGSAGSSRMIPSITSIDPATGQPRRQTEVPAVEDDPTVRPYGCNYCFIDRTVDDQTRMYWEQKQTEHEDYMISWRTIKELREHSQKLHKERDRERQIASAEPNPTGSALEMPFRCALEPCGKTFKSLAGLRFHFQNASANGHFVVTLEKDTETGEERAMKKFKEDVKPSGRELVCPVDRCPKRFKQSAGLAYHLSHTANHPITEAQVSAFEATLASKTRWWFKKLGLNFAA